MISTSCLCGTQGCLGKDCNPLAYKLAKAHKTIQSLTPRKCFRCDRMVTEGCSYAACPIPIRSDL